MPQSFELPEDIPWQLLCTNRDMMDIEECNKKYPMPWRSSFSISAYEVPEEELPTPFCNGRLTYIKVTTSITGYQPTDQEIEDGYTQLGGSNVEVGLDEIFGEYFGCYGVLLNIALHPNSATAWPFMENPKIIAMEPTLRELVQSATETGELMTASKSGLSTSKSFTNTDSQKTGISANAGAEIPIFPNKDSTSKITNYFGKTTPSIGFSHEWGNTQEDKDLTSIDSSNEKAETQSKTTNIEQLYNTLTGYHVGTNRAVFLMLPRPHILQPTDRRTFVQGVRSIEGMQEYFLAVVRPYDMEGICVDTRLDTGHFPENVKIIEPLPNYKESTVDFELKREASNGKPFSVTTTQLNAQFTVPGGWVIDKRTNPPYPPPQFPKGDPGHIGIKDSQIGLNLGAPQNYNYQAVNDTTIHISGYIQGGGWLQLPSIFHHKYTVYLRSIEPIESDLSAYVDISDMFVTTRTLCCCFYKEPAIPCLTLGPVPTRPAPPIVDTTYSDIVEQRKLQIPASLLSDPITDSSLEPAVKGLLRQLKSVMVTSRDHRFSHTEGGINFLQSDYFVKRILQYFPDNIKETDLSSVPEILPAVVDGFGGSGTVEDALQTNLADFRIKTGLDVADSVSQRQILINLVKVTP